MMICIALGAEGTEETKPSQRWNAFLRNHQEAIAEVLCIGLSTF
jgi:hypothetical protein